LIHNEGFSADRALQNGRCVAASAAELGAELMRYPSASCCERGIVRMLSTISDRKQHPVSIYSPAGAERGRWLRAYAKSMYSYVSKKKEKKEKSMYHLGK
jgi:hypothetical protein